MGVGNRLSTSHDIDLPLQIRLSAQSQRNIKMTRELVQDLLTQLDKQLNLGLDKSAISTVKGMQEEASRLGVSINQAGKSWEVMATNAKGLYGYVKGIAGEWKKIDGVWTPTKSEITGSGTSATRDSNASRIITVTKEYERQEAVVNRLLEKGYKFAEEGSAEYNLLKLEEEERVRILGNLQNALETARKITTEEDSQLSHTIKRSEHTLKEAEAQRNLALEKGETLEIEREKNQILEARNIAIEQEGEQARYQNQQAQEYLRLLQEEYAAEEKLAAAKQQGGNSRYIQGLEKQRDYYRDRRQEIENNIKGTEAYNRVQGKAAEITLKHNNAINKMGGTLKNTGGVLNNIKSMLTNVVVYGTAYKALYAVMNAFKDTINIVKELDKSLVDLQIATGKSREEASKMLDTYNEIAQSVGATTKQVADSATTWLRQGYSEADTNKLIYDSMVLSKVGMIESADATKYLTSAMKGYQVSVDDAMSIIDKLAVIDLHAAVTSGELAEAMSKTANSARLAGVSMDELLGYIATVSEVTQQSASTVGTSFKSIFSRFSKIAAGTFVDEETGEDLKIWVAAA